MSLETKSITELRGIAQALGLKLDWGWEKLKLIEKINAKTNEKPSPFPRATAESIESTIPSTVDGALAPFVARGLIVTYPGDNTVRMTYHSGKVTKDDSCNLDSTLRTIAACARKIMEV